MDSPSLVYALIVDILSPNVQYRESLSENTVLLIKIERLFMFSSVGSAVTLIRYF